MKETWLPLGALLLLSWTLLVTMEPQHQESVVDVPGGEGLRTSFSCRGRIQGYYADIETGCRLYHLCDETGRQFTNACPNLTLFQQRMMICDHWYMVNCSASVVNYAANLLLGRRDQPFLKTEDHQQSWQKQRVPLPVTFPRGDVQDEAVKTQETSTSRQPASEYPAKTSSASSKRKSPVNRGKTVSFSISSLSAASQEDYYRRNQGRTKSQRRPSQSSRVAANQDSVQARFPPTESTTASVTSSTSYSFSDVSGDKVPQINNRYGPELARTESSSKINQDSYRVQKAYQSTQNYESSSPRTQSNFSSSHTTNNDQVQNIYEGTNQFVTTSPKSVSNFDTSTLKSSYNQAEYFARTNSPSLTTQSNLPYKYGNNPFFQNYFRSSSPVIYTTTPLPPVFNIAEDEDEDEHSGNRIEIVLQDPRRMFFIPDSEFDLNSVLDAKNTTVLVIPVPHYHGAMRFRSYDRLIEGRNPQCPRCHPAFLLPGQCQPCVLIK